MSNNKTMPSGKRDGAKKRYKSDGTRITSTTIHGPGVFVTCVKGKERLAGNEIRDVFESVALELWPISLPEGGESVTGASLSVSDSEGEEDEDLEAQIARDIVKIQLEQEQSVQSRNGRSGGANGNLRKRIVIHYTDAPCLLFASCAAPIDPVALTLAYLEEVKGKGIARTRAVQRLEPVASTCVASLPELLLLSKKLLQGAFRTKQGSEAKSYSYKIVVKVRNNSKLSSRNIIDELPQVVPLGHSVSLKHPDLTILVIVFKSIVGVGVVPRYEELKKYNVAQLVEARDLDVDLGGTSRLRKVADQGPFPDNA